MSTELTIEGKPTDASFDFYVRHRTGVIPATFWNAERPLGAKTPISLVQHGGPLHKRHERTEWLVKSILARTGGAVLLIDGPIHGQRRTEQLELMAMLGEFKEFWRKDGGIDAMVSDWKRVLDIVLEEQWADPNRIAWVGVSMGTAYGIPVCASDERIKAAVFGMWSTDWGQETRLIEDARRMKTPTLFQIKAEDEIFAIAGQRKLFDAVGSANKTLSTYPGGHSLTAPGQLDQILDFVTETFHEAKASESSSGA